MQVPPGLCYALRRVAIAADERLNSFARRAIADTD